MERIYSLISQSGVVFAPNAERIGKTAADLIVLWNVHFRPGLGQRFSAKGGYSG